MVTIRPEEPGDDRAVQRIHERAFDGPVEAKVVRDLRAGGGVLLSLVALKDDLAVGHALFSPLLDESGAPLGGGVALGPMAVLPEHQRLGIGSRLVRNGLERLKSAGHGFVVVLGHPEYYPRFGFVPAREYGMSCQFDVPPEVFMVLELEERALEGRRGRVRYRPEFDAA